MNRQLASGKGASRVQSICLRLTGGASLLVLSSVLGNLCIAQPDSQARTPEVTDPTYFETGVANVALKNPSSGQRFVETNGLGTTSDDGLMHNFYSNASGTDILDLVEHPGSIRNSFSEIILFRQDCFPLGATATKTVSFVSSKGIKLGLRATEVRRILGKPHDVKTVKSGKVTYKYTCDDPAKCPSLAKYNMPTYTAVAEFANGRLVKYSFGYDYP